MDEADRAAPNIANVIDDAVKEAMRRVSEIPIGNPGDCDGCGEYYSRLVNGMCGFCRDKYGA